MAGEQFDQLSLVTPIFSLLNSHIPRRIPKVETFPKGPAAPPWLQVALGELPGFLSTIWGIHLLICGHGGWRQLVGHLPGTILEKSVKPKDLPLLRKKIPCFFLIIFYHFFT